MVQTLNSADDKTVLARFEQAPHWGLSTTIDLYTCDPEAIRSFEHIASFAVAVCDFIQMKRYGDPQIVRFGNTPEICGVTLIQLIETSSMVAHFIDATNDGCIDLCSCAPYGPQAVAEFCRPHGPDHLRISWKAHPVKSRVASLYIRTYVSE